MKIQKTLCVVSGHGGTRVIVADNPDDIDMIYRYLTTYCWQAKHFISRESEYNENIYFDLRSHINKMECTCGFFDYKEELIASNFYKRHVLLRLMETPFVELHPRAIKINLLNNSYYHTEEINSSSYVMQ